MHVTLVKGFVDQMHYVPRVNPLSVDVEEKFGLIHQTFFHSFQLSGNSSFHIGLPPPLLLSAHCMPCLSDSFTLSSFLSFISARVEMSSAAVCVQLVIIFAVSCFTKARD